MRAKAKIARLRVLKDEIKVCRPVPISENDAG